MLKWFKKQTPNQQKSDTPENVKIFLDPDGTEDLGLCLLVPHPTGIFYENQCGGTLCMQNSVEGFLVPLGMRDIEQELYDFFMREFDENCYPPHNEWTHIRIEELSKIIRKVSVFLDGKEGDTECVEPLDFDRDRAKECVEAWIPVKSVYGKSILVLKNSD